MEGSTRLLHELGAEGYAQQLAEHRSRLRAAFSMHGGVEVDTQGDAFFVAFASAESAVAAAAAAQRSLDAGPIRVRMGLHTGTPLLTSEGYVGEDVHLGARIGSAGHGGQVLLSGATRAAVGVEALDLGEHRLKDFEQPVQIFQLGAQAFPPLKTISNTNLPRPASSFVGREREVAAVAGLIRDGARLVTLTGPGGTGKSRLAIEAAAELVPETKAGVFWVGLAAERDPALVVERIARTLGATGDLAAHIGERELLLLLDNFEQVVEAASCLTGLLEACANLRFVVTSRELLNVRGEVEYPVLPLASDEAVDLFVGRSGGVREPRVAELCRRLDNLPLAIELAAARTRVLSLEQILDRLSQRLDLLRGGRDADPRQRTLRATIEWSYDLLQGDEQRLFARLAVFDGGCTLEAAEHAASADVDGLQSLVEKSLLRRTGDRFWMLETIRELAAEKLGDADDLRADHAAYYAQLAARARPHLAGTSPTEWLDLLEEELPNLRQAFEHRLATDPAAAQQLAADLARVWVMRGHLVEGASALERAVAAAATPTPARAGALIGAAIVAGQAGDMARAEAYATEALGFYRGAGDEAGIAYALYVLGVSHVEQGTFDLARELFTESLARFVEHDNRHYVLLATDSLAYTYGCLGDRARCVELHEETLRRAREWGDDAAVALAVAQLATVHADEADYATAAEMIKESIRLNRRLDRKGAVVESLTRLARVCALAGRHREAAVLVSTAESAIAEIGGAMPWVPVQNAETRALAQVEARPLSLDDAYAFVEQLEL